MRTKERAAHQVQKSPHCKTNKHGEWIEGFCDKHLDLLKPEHEEKEQGKNAERGKTWAEQGGARCGNMRERGGVIGRVRFVLLCERGWRQYSYEGVCICVELYAIFMVLFM
jgi:hypothetical protein